MMEKKRLVGVTAFGYFGIIFGIFGVIEQLLKRPQVDLIVIFVSVAYILLSYNLIRLRRWSRLMLLILNGIAVFLITITNVIILFGLPWKEIVKIFQERFPYFTIIAVIMFLMFHIYIYGFIFFFTRPKVKELFK